VTVKDRHPEQGKGSKKDFSRAVEMTKTFAAFASLREILRNFVAASSLTLTCKVP
jgi:hypothetical protein